MVVAPDRINCLYEVGETARLTVCAEGTNGVKLARGVLSVRVDNFGNREILTREIDLAKENPFQLSVTRDAPGFIRLGVTSKDKTLAVRNNAGQGAGTYTYGVAFSPTKIQPGSFTLLLSMLHLSDLSLLEMVRGCQLSPTPSSFPMRNQIHYSTHLILHQVHVLWRIPLPVLQQFLCTV